MTRYVPARYYFWFGMIGLGLAAFSGWMGLSWAPAFIPGTLFLVSSTVLLTLAFWPAIEVHETYLAVGKRPIAWADIRKLNRTGWISPLIVHITLFDNSKLFLVYPGDVDSCNGLLRQLRRFSRDALIDGKPYRQYWWEVMSPGTDQKQLTGPRQRILRPEDEAEVERLYQRLKTVGNLDQKTKDEN